MEEVPGSEESLLALDEQPALTSQNEEGLLIRLGVVNAALAARVSGWRRSKIRTVLHLLALILIGAVIWVVLHSLPLFFIGGLDWDDLRNVLLYRAFGSFTYEGDVIPGVRPALGTRLLVLALSREDDARRALVEKAMAGSERRHWPLVGKVRLLLRLWTGTSEGAELSRALVQVRWFAAPPLGAQFRARSVANARERVW